MNAEKDIFKEKIMRKNYETLLKLSQRWEKIHCKIIHIKITFFNIFGHLHYFLDWSHGTWYRLDTWTYSFTFHFVFIRRHFAHHSIFYFEAYCIGISDSNTIEISVDSALWCTVNSSHFILFSFASSHLHTMFVTLHVRIRSQINK